MFFLQCVLVGLLCTFAQSGAAPIGGYPLKYIMQRPFIGGLLCGIIFGDVAKGVIIGCEMQLVYIGYFQVGGVGSMDMGIISFPCVALALTSGIETTSAIALATTLATLFTSIDRFGGVITAMCGEVMKRGAEEVNYKKFAWGYVGLPTVYYAIQRGVTSFLLVYFGTPAVDAVLAIIPNSLVKAFAAIANFLPAIGMASLMGYLVDDIWGIVFFVFGWACYGYLKIDWSAIVFIAIVVAYLYYRSSTKTVTVSNDNDEEDI